MTENTASSQISTSNNQQFLCGDLVIHPTRNWPWLGTIHPKSVDFAQMCNHCGGLCVTLDFSQAQYDVPTKSVMICDKCGEETYRGVEDDEPMLVDSDCPHSSSEQIVDQAVKACEKLLNCGQLNMDDLLNLDEVQSSSNVLAAAKNVGCNKKWQVNWFPVGEIADVDGNEIIILPFKQRSLFQEGNPVAKKDNSMSGVVKQVHRKIDAFLLPDYKFLVCDVPSDRLLPISPMEQSPGCYVIYKGWVGTIFNVFNRIHFRLTDGTECYVTDADNERLTVHIKETDKKTSFDPHQLYPGQKVKIRWCVLEKAIWADGRVEMPKDFVAKINKSRENFQKEGFHAQSYTSADQLAMEDKLSLGGDGMHYDASYMKKVTKHFMETVVKNFSNAAAHQMSNVNAVEENIAETKTKNDELAEDWTEATVVKIEPVKIDVEWISQVITDPDFSETSVNANCIEGNDLKNITMFRACRAYESFDLGSRYKLKIDKNDHIFNVDDWRRKMLPTSDDGGDKVATGESFDIVNQTDELCVAVARSATKIDVLWEDGTFEKNIDPSDLSAQYSHPVDRNYFPAMYVLLQGSSQSSTTSNVDVVNNATAAAATSKKPSSKGLNDFALQSRFKNLLPEHFGIVRSAKNSEKYATVDWYEFNVGEFRNASSENIVEPIKIKTEDVSFYDLRFYHDFNYICGTLISRIKTKFPSKPNVGYVRRKNPDGTVLVVWYDGTEETTFPWTLKQLNSRMYYSEYSASDADNDHCYSPTEHEYEDLEDFRYYDYASLSEAQRHKRVALIVVLLKELIPRLIRAIVIAYKYFSTLDRKKFVKLTLSTNDVTNGFAQMCEFKENLKNVYDNETEICQKQQAKFSSNRNMFRDEKLVWQCANWLYDWTEAMSTLQEDIRKDQYRLLMLKKNSAQKTSPKLEKNSKLEDQENVTVCNDMNADESSDDDIMVPMDVDDDPIAVELVELLRSIETGLSTVTGILAVPSSGDVSSGLIMEYVNNCRKENSAAMQCQRESSSSSSNDNNNVSFADLTSSHSFLFKLVFNSSKTSRLPCFSFAHRSDQDLSELRNKWNVQSLKEGRFKRNAKAPDENISAQAIVERTSAFVESVLDGQRDVSCRDDDVLQLCHEIADGLCLSVLSILNSVVNCIGSRLSTEIAKLFDSPLLTENATSSTASIDNETDLKQTNDSDFSHSDVQPCTNLSAPHSVDDDHNNPPIFDVHHGCFEVLPTSPSSHRFLKKTLTSDSNLPKTFYAAVRREIKLLQTSLPPGIFVKSYEDRMDLFSCMIVGPQGTPYADGLFFFDIRLRDDYPNRPPHAFFKSMSKSLNPNLYEDGMVCLSLLGTWDGKEVELWSPASTLLQVFVSIQSLILVSEPYFNEPGYEKEKGTYSGSSKSRDYNESAVLRTLESMKRILTCPPEPFYADILRHIKENGPRLMKLLDIYQQTNGDNSILSFPLFPVTQGFCLCIKRHANTMLEAMQSFVARAEDNKNMNIDSSTS